MQLMKVYVKHYAYHKIVQRSDLFKMKIKMKQDYNANIFLIIPDFN